MCAARNGRTTWCVERSDAGTRHRSIPYTPLSVMRVCGDTEIALQFGQHHPGLAGWEYQLCWRLPKLSRCSFGPAASRFHLLSRFAPSLRHLRMSAEDSTEAPARQGVVAWLERPRS